MKKIFLTGIFIISFLIIGCATTSEPKIVENEAELVPVQEEKAPSVNFLDWQYKGFGQELPDWVEPAFFNYTETVLEKLPEFANEKIVIMKSNANTLDQAEAGLNQLVEQECAVGELVFSLKKRTWVQIDEKSVDETISDSNTYVALGICVLETKVGDN